MRQQMNKYNFIDNLQNNIFGFFYLSFKSIIHNGVQLLIVLL